MIFPTYYRGMSEKQIRTAIRGLKNEIGYLKNKIERERFEESKMIICPSKAVQLICARENLERAKEALEEFGCTYTPSKAEMKANEFQERIPHISRISFETGGCFAGVRKYFLEIEKSDIKRISTEFGQIQEESLIDKERTIGALEDLHMGEWRRHYYPERHGCIVYDGIQWSVVIEYDNGHKAVKFEGSNDYPYNFSDFLSLFGLSDEIIGE